VTNRHDGPRVEPKVERAVAEAYLDAPPRRDARTHSCAELRTKRARVSQGKQSSRSRLVEVNEEIVRGEHDLGVLPLGGP
jgi:hypothetical protein